MKHETNVEQQAISSLSSSLPTFLPQTEEEMQPFVDYSDQQTGHLFSTLTEDNFILFAVRHYDNSKCLGISEFNEDINKLRTIQKQMTRYSANQNALNIRLLVNNVICFFNVFEIDAAKVMILYKIKQTQWPTIITILSFLGFIDHQKEFRTIPIDQFVLDFLQKEL